MRYMHKRVTSSLLNPFRIYKVCVYLTAPRDCTLVCLHKCIWWKYLMVWKSLKKKNRSMQIIEPSSKTIRNYEVIKHSNDLSFFNANKNYSLMMNTKEIRIATQIDHMNNALYISSRRNTGLSSRVKVMEDDEKETFLAYILIRCTHPKVKGKISRGMK